MGIMQEISVISVFLDCGEAVVFSARWGLVRSSESNMLIGGAGRAGLQDNYELPVTPPLSLSTLHWTVAPRRRQPVGRHVHNLLLGRVVVFVELFKTSLSCL